MDILERLAYWKSIAVDAVRGEDPNHAAQLEAMVWNNEDDLYCFFGLFQPDGKRVERVFAGVVGGDEILQRLLPVYECSENFIVRRPLPATPERLVGLTAQHLGKVRQIAIDFGEAELASLLEVSPEIKIKREAILPQTRSDFNAPEASVYEITGDWFRELVPVQSDALLMKEAFYSIACDYKIARYLLWPLYRHSTNIEDPFAPYFELWRHGALPFFGRPGLVTVYVTGDT